MIYISAHTCKYVWTGGWTSVPGNKDSFVWLYTDDLAGPSEPMTYRNWYSGQPNGGTEGQNIIRLYKGYSYTFTDGDIEYASATNLCYICEC